ncbi:MAG: hypothetical protein ACREKN_05700, partial [Longimicrobiaceae bacterium]
MKTILCNSALVLSVAALTACGGGDERTEAVPDTPATAEPAGGMEGMEGMEGMQGTGGMMGMLEEMQTHMRMMQGTSGDSMMAMLPMHRQMTANMISRMNREMRDMNMAADEEWNSTIEALREELVQMPEMSAAELEEFMPAHR